jgi:hypothetical protein
MKFPRYVLRRTLPIVPRPGGGGVKMSDVPHNVLRRTLCDVFYVEHFPILLLDQVFYVEQIVKIIDG